MINSGSGFSEVGMAAYRTAPYVSPSSLNLSLTDSVALWPRPPKRGARTSQPRSALRSNGVSTMVIDDDPRPAHRADGDARHDDRRHRPAIDVASISGDL